MEDRSKEGAKDHSMKHCEQTLSGTATPGGRCHWSQASSSSSTQWRESAKWHDENHGKWHGQHWWDE